MDTISLPVEYYQQFDADFERDVPAEGYGGWQQAEVEISRSHTGIVVMHAWNTGTREEFPGWHRIAEYIPRADRICREVMPKLLAAVRQAGLPVFHVVGGGDYYKDCPGYKRAVELAGPAPEQPVVEADPILKQLQSFKREHSNPGLHNAADVSAGFAHLDFAPNTKPVGDEGVAEDGRQLFALCREAGVNHLIYSGFAINMCLQNSPGGMIDMARYGIMRSVLREAVTAVENKETAEDELAKEIALWLVAVNAGFVFDVEALVAALTASDSPTAG